MNFTNIVISSSPELRESMSQLEALYRMADRALFVPSHYFKEPGCEVTARESRAVQAAIIRKYNQYVIEYSYDYQI